MATKGITAADFGRTASSQKFFRTREDGGDVDLGEGSGATPAAAAFLAELRQEVGAQPSGVPPAPAPKKLDDLNFFADVVPKKQKKRPPPPQQQPPPPQQVRAFQPPMETSPRPHKEFLSKAERKRLKKQQQGEGQQPPPPQPRAPLAPPVTSGSSSSGGERPRSAERSEATTTEAAMPEEASDPDAPPKKKKKKKKRVPGSDE